MDQHAPVFAATPPPLPNPDEGHLKLLAIFHYVLSGFGVFGLGFIALHYTLMRTVFANPAMWENQAQKGAKAPFDPNEFFEVFQWFYLAAGLLIVVLSVLTLMAGLAIKNRKSRTFTMVVAGINCLQFPFGMALGIFTLVVLSRDSVARLYRERAAARIES